MISVFELYKIGIGPSSSHTVGPMKAACDFIEKLNQSDIIQTVDRIAIDLFGSLGSTGKGHASDIAVVLGLMGEFPDQIDTNKVSSYIETIRAEKKLLLDGKHPIVFDEFTDLVLHQRKSLPYHPNAMTIKAFSDEAELASETYYSLGGGFIINDRDIDDESSSNNSEVSVPYPFSSAEELLVQCKKHQLSIANIVLENEKTLYSEKEIFNRLSDIWQVMQECVDNGCRNQGILPGGLNVKRRANNLFKQLKNEQSEDMMLNEMDWVNLYAMAVNEENAAGGRVVTAPTNGAAGIIPAVLHYYRDFSKKYDEKKVYEFLLASAAIGILIKQNASISGAEVGCQGEVGSACAMAAAGLTQILGGTPEQCTNAAEIGIEHNLGLTCDPIGGLVQVPCIERNAIASVKAINASQMARRGDGEHFVSLDKAIKTMKDTGKDMMDKYKETAQGGLAVNVIEVPVNFVEC